MSCKLWAEWKINLFLSKMISRPPGSVKTKLPCDNRSPRVNRGTAVFFFRTRLAKLAPVTGSNFGLRWWDLNSRCYPVFISLLLLCLYKYTRSWRLSHLVVRRSEVGKPHLKVGCFTANPVYVCLLRLSRVVGNDGVLWGVSGDSALCVFINLSVRTIFLLLVLGF